MTREQAWEEWLTYLLRGVAETAAWTTAKIAAIRELAAHTIEFVRAGVPKIYSHELVNLIFEKLYCRIADVTHAGIAARQAASRYLKELVRIRVLEEKSIGKEKLFLHPKFLNLLTREGNTFTPYA